MEACKNEDKVGRDGVYETPRIHAEGGGPQLVFTSRSGPNAGPNQAFLGP